MKDKDIFRNSLVNSLLVSIYVLLVASLMWKGDVIFGTMDQPLGVATFLMLFTISAGIVGTLVLGKPLMLYLDGKKKEGVAMLISTLLILLILTSISLIIMALI